MTKSALVTAGLGLVGALLWGAAPAHAHAVLLATHPFDGEVLDAAPKRVTLTFNEPVSSPPAGVRVFDQEGRRIDAGRTRSVDGPKTLGVDLDDALVPGTYVVSWRAVSGDSHPVRGAFLFEIRGPGGVRREADADRIASILGATSDPGYELAAAAARFFQYGGILVASGGALFLAFVHDGRAGERVRQVRVVRLAAAVGALAIVVSVPIQAALATGLGRDAMADLTALGDVLGDQFGWSAIVGVTGLALVWIGLRRTRVAEGDLVAVGGGLVASTSLALVGHPLVSDPKWLVVGADAVHAAAASAWVGGLFALALVLHSRRRIGTDDPGFGPERTAVLVRRFSSMAAVSILGVAAAGSVLAWSEVRALRALTSTDYGIVLLVKLAAVAAILAIAGFNRFGLLPAVTRRASGAAWRFLRTAVRLELVGVVVVLALTAALVNIVPAKTHAGVVGVFSDFADLGDGAQVNVVIDPNRAGRNQVHLYLIDETGRPADIVEDVTIRFSMPSEGIGPIERVPERAGPGHWILTGGELSISGVWQVEVVARTSEFEQQRASTEVFVNR